MWHKCLLLLAVLLHETLQDISPFQNDPAMWTPNDNIQVNMSELFNLTLATGNVSYQCNKGQYIDYKTNWAITDITKYGFGKVDFVHFIDNQTYVSIFDESHILVHTVSLDGLSITKEVKTDFNRPGTYANCTDMDANNHMGRYYLVCFQPSVVGGDPGDIYVYEIDMNTGQTLNTLSVELTDQFSGQHTMKLGIYNVTVGNTPQRVVIVYDQGLSATNTTKNFWLAVFTGVDTGSNLAFQGFLDLKAQGYSLTSFFDCFNYNQKLVLTGFLQSKSIVSLLSCSLGLSPISLSCSNPINTLITKGYVGIINTGQFVQVNLAAARETAQICDLSGPIEQQTWKSCRSILDIETIDEAFITEVVGNKFITMIKYDYPDGTYAGYTIYTNVMDYQGTEWISTDPTVHATVINKQIHLVNSKQTWVNWMMPPAVTFSPVSKYWSNTWSSLNCTATDTSGSCASGMQVLGMNSIYDEVLYNSTHLQAFQTYEGTSYDIFLSPDDIEGNDLNISVTFPANVSKYIAPFVFDTKNIAINWVFKTSSYDFKEVTFFGEYAVSLDRYNNLALYRCGQYLSLVDCFEIDNRHIHPSEVLQKKMWVIQGFPVVWTSNTTRTTVYIWDNVFSKTSYVHTFSGTVADVAATELDDRGFILGSLTKSGIIEHFYFVQMNPSMANWLTPINQQMSGSEFFCPTTLYICPHGANVLEVLSACNQGPDLRMLKYTYWPGNYSFNLRNTIPINLQMYDGTFCPMGGEFIFSSINSSTLFGAPTYFENATYSYGIDELNIGEFIKVDCVPSLSMFSIVSQDANHNLVLSIFKGNNQYQGNNKVYNVLRSGFSGVSDITNHNFLGNMIHVKQMVDGTYSYMMTYSGSPMIHLFVLNGIAPINTTMNISFYNNRSGSQISKNFEILQYNYNVTTKSLGRANFQPVGYFYVEDFIQISGPLTEVRVTGINESELEVFQRVSIYNEYRPDNYHQYTFQHMERADGMNLALHIDNANQASFALFSGIDQYAYTFSPFPGVGIKSFDFAQIISGSSNSTILVAACTDGMINNVLEVMVVSNGVVISTGWYQDSDCQKVKLVRRDNGTLFYAFMQTGTGDDSLLTVVNISYDASGRGSISTEAIDYYTSVQTFGVGPTNISAYLMMVFTSDLNDPFVAHYFKNETGKPMIKKGDKSRLKNLKFWRSPFRIRAIECEELDDIRYTCIYDTLSTQMFEVIVSETHISDLMVYSYAKVPDFQGIHYAFSPNYFGVMNFDRRNQRAEIHVYKRIEAGGSGMVWGQHSVESFNAPYTILDRSNETSVLAYCTRENLYPLRFAHIRPVILNFRVNNTQNLNLSAIKVHFMNGRGQQASTVTLAEIFGSTSDGSTHKFWVFGLILAVLILFGIGYTVYVRTKAESSGSEIGESGKFASVGENAMAAKGDKV